MGASGYPERSQVLGKLIDLTGRRFGRLVVLGRASGPAYGAFWLCRCDCGEERTNRGGTLLGGRVKSCGCLKGELGAAVARGRSTHGQTTDHRPTPEYLAWRNMHRRCSNPKDPAFLRYGGAGIKVCAEWADFERFFSDMGPRPSADHSLDRKENALGYSKANCRWATRETQNRNRAISIFVELDGERLPLVEACRRTGKPYALIVQRIRDLGWTEERAFAAPSRRRK